MKREDNILSDAEHLYAEDFGGRDATLTIASIDREEVANGRGGKERKYVFRFQETKKAYVPGIGVRRAMVRAMHTNDRNKMIGRRIVLFPTTCDAFGEKNIPCIRFKRVAEQSDAPTGNIDSPENKQQSDAAKRQWLDHRAASES